MHLKCLLQNLGFFFFLFPSLFFFFLYNYGVRIQGSYTIKIDEELDYEH